jgi:hypothetical protein
MEGKDMISMGEMIDGSVCCECGKDIGGQFGVTVDSEDYCTDCIEM